ncbi:GNAT family N-acetyltransferase [Listeria rustica]|uniref:GNAT family N-acetyltransferase n=1 Tax=Listeria rustica TaxID=2713503 RepID=A0A7W1T572_9LIST|nr:GNAT family N-acetyltransferase [Listeria rustica]MBA3925736.1 GNAT family N-acetyltransferase [Listeria rustica]
MKIKKWTECDIIPYELLLLADPDKSAIDRYFFQSDVFLLIADDQTCGVICIQNEGDCSEIVNIAVLPNYQGRQYGKELLEHAITNTKKLYNHTLIVKTANSSMQALAFYQKAGFRMIEIIPDYFLKHYSEPIFENGILAQDQIVMLYKINK